MEKVDTIIKETRDWVLKVVVGLNFCPFAAPEVKKDSIRYAVCDSDEKETMLLMMADECKRLDADPSIETTLLILPVGMEDFNEYLDLVSTAELLIEQQGYEGIYQVAGFHPDYVFFGSDEEDAANYTNRSIYPMLHLIREETIERVIEGHPDPDGIPERNIEYAREMGLQKMRALREACIQKKKS